MIFGGRTAWRAYNTTSVVTASYDYDSLGRLTDMDAGISRAKFSYTYESGENNIDKIVFHHRGPTVYNDYSYDDLDRVTRADYLVNLQPNIFEAFNMDDLGNRLSTTLRDGSADTYSVDTTSNRYNSIDSAALAYDDAGNLTTDKDGYHTVYDYENRPVRIYKLNGQTQVTVATLDYDALGRRIRKVDAIANTASLYYYSDNWQVLAEYNGSGTLQKTFVFGNYIDEVLVMTNYQPLTTNDYYYLHDHLYSPAALLDNSGSVVERYEYDAYGTCRILTPGFGLLTSSQYGNPYTFTGRELDNFDIVGGTPGLTKMHYRHRDYSPFMGRFDQQDPMQYVDGLNLYQYVKGRPLGFPDPWGFATFEQLLNENYEILHKGGVMQAPEVDWAHGAWKAGGEPDWLTFFKLIEIRNRAYYDVLAAMAAYPWLKDATLHLWHFLDNSGSTVAIDYPRMLRETPMTREKDFLTSVNRAVEWAEKLYDPDKKVTTIVQQGYSRGFALGNRNWQYAIQTYHTWGKGIVSKGKCCYCINLSFDMIDLYEFENKHMRGSFVYDDEMWLLNYYGLAQNFKIVGSLGNMIVKWQKGSRLKPYHTNYLIQGSPVILDVSCYGE